MLRKIHAVNRKKISRIAYRSRAVRLRVFGKRVFLRQAHGHASASRRRRRRAGSYLGRKRCGLSRLRSALETSARRHGRPSPKLQAPSRALSPSLCSMTPPHCKSPDAQASYFWGARERKPTGTWLAHSKEAPHSPKALVPPMQQAFCCNSRTTNSFPRAHGKSPCSAQEPRR